jgi:hypothetical protein
MRIYTCIIYAVAYGPMIAPALLLLSIVSFSIFLHVVCIHVHVHMTLVCTNKPGGLLSNKKQARRDPASVNAECDSSRYPPRPPILCLLHRINIHSSLLRNGAGTGPKKNTEVCICGGHERKTRAACSQAPSYSRVCSRAYYITHYRNRYGGLIEVRGAGGGAYQLSDPNPHCHLPRT